MEPAKPKAEEPAKLRWSRRSQRRGPATPKPVKAKPATVKEPADRPLTVADKMEHAPVADLRKAIALSQKFWFVAELFGGDRKRYEEAIDAINGMGSLEEAQSYMTTEITAKQAKAGYEVRHLFHHCNAASADAYLHGPGAAAIGQRTFCTRATLREGAGQGYVDTLASPAMYGRGYVNHGDSPRRNASWNSLTVSAWGSQHKRFEPFTFRQRFPIFLRGW